MKTIFLLTLLTLTLNAFAASVTVAWDANTDGVTKGYYVYTFQNSTQVSKLDTFLSNTFTIPNLANSTTYSIYVKAYDINRAESLASNTITVTTPPTSTPVPVAPALSSAISTKNGPNWDIDITWGAVAGATSYSVQIINAANTVLFTNTSTTLTTKFTNIPSGQYTFIAKSINSSGPSQASAVFGPIINLSIPANLKAITISP